MLPLCILIDNKDAVSGHLAATCSDQHLIILSILDHLDWLVARLLFSFGLGLLRLVAVRRGLHFLDRRVIGGILAGRLFAERDAQADQGSLTRVSLHFDLLVDHTAVWGLHFASLGRICDESAFGSIHEMHLIVNVLYFESTVSHFLENLLWH